MQRRQCSPEQISTSLEQAEREQPSRRALCRAYAMRETTGSRWRKPCGGMAVIAAQASRIAQMVMARRGAGMFTTCPGLTACATVMGGSAVLSC